MGCFRMNYFDTLENEISSWSKVSVHSHRFGAKEFRFGSAEIGHIHPGGVVDIPFPRSVRDALLTDGLAEEHHWVPNSGWITFGVRSEQDIKHALWLMRYRICATPSRPQLTHANCSNGKPTNYN